MNKKQLNHIKQKKSNSKANLPKKKPFIKIDK